MDFLVSTSYRTTGRSTIWKLDADSGQLDMFREDQFYQPGERHKDQIYFGMAISGSKLYCAGGAVLSVLELDGKLIDRREPGFLRDAHDLEMIGDELFCTNTGHDRIEVFDVNLDHKRTIDLSRLPAFRDRQLTEKSPSSPDSLHANFVSGRDGQVYVTHSYTCERDMYRTLLLALRQRTAQAIGHPLRRNRGTVYSLRAGKMLDSGGVLTLDGKRVVDGLYGAHDGVFYQDKFYVNATHNIETWVYDKSFKPVKTIEYGAGMLIRGLCPLDDSTLVLGATRIDPGRTASSIYRPIMRARGNDRFDDFSSVKIIDVGTGRVVETLHLAPYLGIHPEVYKIIPLERRSSSQRSQADPLLPGDPS